MSSGSRITRPGIIAGWKMIRLTWSPRVSVMAEARPVSEPVPEVVGTATTGTMPASPTRVHQSSRSSKSQMGRDCPTMSADRLPRVESAAAPEGDDPVVVPVAKRRHPVLDVRFNRVPADLREDRAAEPRLPARGNRFRHHRQGGKPRVRDEQGAVPCPSSRHASGSSRMRPAPKRIEVG